MSTTRDRRSDDARDRCVAADHRWLVELATTLAADPEAPAAHVVVADDVGPVGRGTVGLKALPPADPVAGLLCRRAGPDTAAIGLVGPSRSRSLVDDTTGEGAFVHLLTPAGVSVTVAPPAGGGTNPRVLGPTTQVCRGRVADACRRILGLPTAPAASCTAGALVDQWLDAVLVATLVDGTLSWAEVLAHHPLAGLLHAIDADPRVVEAARRRRRWLRTATDDVLTEELIALVERRRRADRALSLPEAWLHHLVGLPDAEIRARRAPEAGGPIHACEPGELGSWSPSDVARLMLGAGHTVSWTQIRLAAMCGAGYGDLLDACAVHWMDAPMFARWVTGEALPRSVVLDALARNLPGGVHDLLAATLSLLDAHHDARGTP
jgi:hypothetical protein